MALVFEISDMILSKEQAEHLNFCHVESSSIEIQENFNLTAMLALLKWKRWVPDLEGNYEMIECHFKHGHGEYYIYVFRMIGYDLYGFIYVFRMISYDSYGFPSREICIYFSWKVIYGSRMPVISAYPFSRSYNFYYYLHCQQKKNLI